MTSKHLFVLLAVLIVVSDLVMAKFFGNIYWFLLKDVLIFGGGFWGASWLAGQRIGFLQQKLHEFSGRERMDLNVRFESKHPELGALVDSMNAMQERIEREIASVTESAARLVPMSHELADSYGNATQKAALQDSHSDQILSAMDNIKHASTEVAERARSILEDAIQGNESVNECQQSMAGTQQVVDRLSEHTQRAQQILDALKVETDQVGSIVSVINGIAEQTNLLALNAAIEAARAGEQGRGFAVVADEVRSLAERTRQSTQEVQTMLERIQGGAESLAEAMAEGGEASEENTRQVHQVSEQLDQLANIISRVHGAAEVISEAAEQQQERAVEVRLASDDLAELNRITLTESKHHTISKKDLEALAEQLREKLSVFITPEDYWHTHRRSITRNVAQESEVVVEDDDDVELF